MTPHEYCTNWRQVRLFIPPTTEFRDFHLNNTLPFLHGGNFDTPFFLSHYYCRDQDDGADTNLQALQPQFRTELKNQAGNVVLDKQGQPVMVHRSIRYRWRENEAGDFAEQLKAMIPPNCWSYAFLDYTMPDGMSHGRFSDYPQANVADHERRAQIIGEILHQNSRLYLDMIRPGANGAVSEASNDGLNVVLASPLQSVIHMIINLHGEKRVVGVYTDPQGNVTGRSL